MKNTEAWNYAIGMIKVDGLEPTEDFKRYIENWNSCYDDKYCFL